MAGRNRASKPSVPFGQRDVSNYQRSSGQWVRHQATRRQPPRMTVSLTAVVLEPLFSPFHLCEYRGVRGLCYIGLGGSLARSSNMGI